MSGLYEGTSRDEPGAFYGVGGAYSLSGFSIVGLRKCLCGGWPEVLGGLKGQHFFRGSREPSWKPEIQPGSCINWLERMWEQVFDYLIFWSFGPIS